MPDQCVVADKLWDFCADVVEPREIFKNWEKVEEFSVVPVLIPGFDWNSIVLLESIGNWGVLKNENFFLKMKN